MNTTKTSAFGKFFAFMLIAVLCFALCACGHVHNYVNGVCADCGEICKHDKYTEGVCDECGIVCKHKKYTEGVCDECGIVCLHPEYVNSRCTVCKIVCKHETFENGECTVCDFVCEHETFEDGECKVCGYVCEHPIYNAGVCVDCGTVCEHKNYVDGVCVVCGMPDPNTAVRYNYTPHISDVMPRITISTADGSNDWASLEQHFDMNDLTSKNNRPYNDCTISVSYCEEKYVLNDIAAQVKIRGNYTANYPKKPFRIKFKDKQKMLGLNNDNKFKNWVLLAEWKDNSHLRNSVAYYLGNQILGSDGYYCTDFRLVELYLNDAYWGVYLLAEQQQVNKNRIDITEPDDDYYGTDIGYYIEYDGYYNFETYSERFGCQYNDYAPLTTRDGRTVYPDRNIGFAINNDVYYEGEGEEAEKACAQKLFIRDYINNLYKLCYKAVYDHEYYQFNEDYSALVSYTPTAKTTSGQVMETVSKVIDINSLVDIYIINEIMCDADIAWSSFYMDVDFGANGDKLLRFESPWDFDSAIGLKNNLNDAQSMFAANSNNPWLIIFINEDWFWNKVCEKWQDIRDAGVAEKTLALIDALENNYKSYFQANDERWGFQKDGELCWQAQQANNITETIAYLRDWVEKRFAALDGFYEYYDVEFRTISD